MHIGIDFDNTIISYDSLFHKVAIEQGVIPVDLPKTKLAVRDYLCRQGHEKIWTEMQGYVYGTRMDEAQVYPGVYNFLFWANSCGVAISIVSHKTRYPFIGPKYDLHEAANHWVCSHLVANHDGLVKLDQVFFELTKEKKLQRIMRCGCDVFVDDLPEILLADGFPAGTERILFDPEGCHMEEGLERVRSWNEICRRMERKCQKI